MSLPDQIVEEYRGFTLYYKAILESYRTTLGVLDVTWYARLDSLKDAIDNLLDQTPVPPDPPEPEPPQPTLPELWPLLDWTVAVFRQGDYYTNDDPALSGSVDEYLWAVTLDGGESFISYAEYVVSIGGNGQLSLIPVDVVISYVTANWSWISSALQALGKIFVLDSVVEWLQGPGGEGITTLDNIIARIFDSPGGTVSPPTGGGTIMENPDDPAGYPVGLIRQGWKIKKITTYTIPEGQRRTVKGSKKVWHKDYNSMNFVERAAKFQGQRSQAYESRQAKNAAYVRGFNNGAKAQASQETRVEAGGTPIVQYTKRR